MNRFHMIYLKIKRFDFAIITILMKFIVNQVSFEVMTDFKLIAK